MANEQLDRELNRMLNPEQPVQPQGPQQQGTAQMPQVKPMPAAPKPGAVPGQPAAEPGRPPKPTVSVTPGAAPAPAAPTSEEPTPRPAEAQPAATSVEQAVQQGAMQVEMPQMGPISFNYMPSEEELAGIPDGTQVETPHGSVYKDPQTGERKLRLNAQGYKMMKARAVKKFGKNPFAGVRGMPEPTEIIERGIQGKRMFNPYEPLDMDWLAPDIGKILGTG